MLQDEETPSDVRCFFSPHENIPMVKPFIRQLNSSYLGGPKYCKSPFVCGFSWFLAPLEAPLHRRHVDRAAVASAVGCGHGRPRAAKSAAAVPGGPRGAVLQS